MKDTQLIQNIDYLRSLIEQNNDIGIVIAENHTLDKIAAGLSLYLSLSAQGKNVQVISHRDPIVEFSNLVGIDRLKKSFDGIINTLTISVPYAEGEVEKVSYNIEGDRLNVNLIATNQGITFSEKDIRFIRKGAAPSLVIVVGTTHPNEISQAAPDASSRLVVIDNRALQQGNVDVALADNSFSSVSEIVGEVIRSGGFPIDLDSAQNIYDGIAAATNNFTSQNTSLYAFEITGFALRNGARRRQIRTEGRRGRGEPGGGQGQGQQAPRSDMQRGGMGTPRPTQQPRSQQPQPMRSEPTPHVAPISERSASMVPQEERTQPQSEIAPLSNDVPSDWFTPKIFKGSAHPDEQQQ